MSIVLHPLEVPLVSYDQSHDDTYQKLFSTLTLLDENIQNIFSRIKERLNIEKGDKYPQSYQYFVIYREIRRGE